jgi:hypothetical protein
MCLWGTYETGEGGSCTRDSGSEKSDKAEALRSEGAEK